MKILLIGGTGTISSAVTNLLLNKGHDVYLFNRGNNNSSLPDNVNIIKGDINNEAEAALLLGDANFDVVCDFIGFLPSQVERDFRLFYGKTKQYVYISSASAYHKPIRNYKIREGTTLANPYWEYSRNKIACEDFLMKMYRENGFPVTIVRPSHTYSMRSVPLGVHGKYGSWQVIRRILDGKPVIIHGDGTSLWTITYNEDFAAAFVGLLGNPHAIGEAFHITSDESVTWNQIYYAIADALGVELKPYYVASQLLADVSDYDLLGSLIGDKANTVVFDNSKIKSVVPDYKAAVRMEEGIRKTVEYMLSHPELQVPDPEFDEWCDKLIDRLEALKRDFA